MAGTLLGVLLIIHGLITLAQSPGVFGRGITNPAWMRWWSTPLGRSWLLTMMRWEHRSIYWLAAGFWVASGLGFLGAALGVFADEKWWGSLAVIGALASLPVLAAYFHPFYVPVIVLNAGIVIALL